MKLKKKSSNSWSAAFGIGVEAITSVAESTVSAVSLFSALAESVLELSAASTFLLEQPVVTAIMATQTHTTSKNAFLIRSFYSSQISCKCTIFISNKTGKT